MIETPGLSYGLFHAVAQPTYSWGVIRAVKFPGVNMDIGHIRNLSWSKDNDPNTWIGYNKLRGQYMSALEHAIPERFFNDPAKCNTQGTTTPVTGLPECPQGISAVKAIALATAQGQKIYTITQAVYQANPNIVNTNLSAHSQSTKQAIQNALDTGQEVTVHEFPITQSGWTGAGYIHLDPQTGAGGYIIDGGSNGGTLLFFFLIIAIMVISVVFAATVGLWSLIITASIQAVSYAAFLIELGTSKDPTYLSSKAFLSVMSLAFLWFALWFPTNATPYLYLLENMWLLLDTIPDFFTVYFRYAK